MRGCAFTNVNLDQSSGEKLNLEKDLGEIGIKVITDTQAIVELASKKYGW